MAASSLLLVFLACTTSLTWYAGNGNAKIGAYIVVFYEELETEEGRGLGWESRLRRIEKITWLDRLHLNHFLAALYAILALVSLVFPWVVAKRPCPSLYQGFPLLMALILFGTAMFLLVFCSYPRDRYEEQWRDVKKKENPKS